MFLSFSKEPKSHKKKLFVSCLIFFILKLTEGGYGWFHNHTFYKAKQNISANSFNHYFHVFCCDQMKKIGDFTLGYNTVVGWYLIPLTIKKEESLRTMEFFSVSILEYEKEGLGIKITPNPSHGQRPHLISIKKHSKVILQQNFRF